MKFVKYAFDEKRKYFVGKCVNRHKILLPFTLILCLIPNVTLPHIVDMHHGRQKFGGGPQKPLAIVSWLIQYTLVCDSLVGSPICPLSTGFAYFAQSHGQLKKSHGHLLVERWCTFNFTLHEGRRSRNGIVVRQQMNVNDSGLSIPGLLLSWLLFNCDGPFVGTLGTIEDRASIWYR